LREKVAVFFLADPDFNKYACEYLILKLNEVQTSFEFEIHNATAENLKPFGTKKYYPKSFLLDEFSKIIKLTPKSLPNEDNYFIGIAKMGIEEGEDLFFSTRKNMAIITTKGWEKALSPPSVFEYITSSLAGTLIEMSMRTHASHEIDYHPQTRGCLIDYTDDKQENRVDVLLGYICDSCKAHIEKSLGSEVILSLQKMCSHDWIGETDDKVHAAYNVKKFFKVDLNKDTGFNKTTMEKLRDDLPKFAVQLIIAAVSTIATAIITLWLTHVL
jgi:hypothetical protein